MNSPLIDGLRKQCGGPRDGALLRFALAKALLDADDASAATVEFRRALDFDPHYSAAWKLLGKAHLDRGENAAAAEAWAQGIKVAGERGDKQAEKEMTVFLRRLQKQP